MITWSAAISARDKGEHWQWALVLLGEMAAATVSKNGFAYGAARKFLREGGPLPSHRWDYHQLDHKRPEIVASF